MALPAIPDKLLAEILIRLPTAGDVIRASHVCASFRRVVADRSFHGAPPLLGFLAQRRSGSGKHQYFHPTFVPYPSTPAATPVADSFSFSFLPSRDWALRDVRDGRVLLDTAKGGNGIHGSYFTETVVCDPLHRRYLLLPPIPDDLVALVDDAAALTKERRVYETFLLPPGGGDDGEEDDTSFRVIWMAVRTHELVAFVFSSSTGQWRAGPSLRWRDVFPGGGLPLRPWDGDGMCCCSVRQYANGCFYWLMDWKEKLLVLDTRRRMEFSATDAPPGIDGFSSGDIAIVEEGEDVFAMFVHANAESCQKCIVKRNSDGSYSQWIMVRTVSLYSKYFFIGSMGRKVLLYKYGTPNGYFSLDIKTFQLKRVCALMPERSNTHIYSNFPPSLLSPPTVSTGTQEGAEGLC